MTVTLCTAWSIYHLVYASLVLLAHRQSAVLPSQLVDIQSCQSSFSASSRIFVSHAADHSTGNGMCRGSSSRQSYCCRESYSHPGRLLADRGLKRRLVISKIVLPLYQSIEAWYTVIQRRRHINLVNLPRGLENSVFFLHFIKRALHWSGPSLPVQFIPSPLKPMLQVQLNKPGVLWH